MAKKGSKKKKSRKTKTLPIGATVGFAIYGMEAVKAIQDPASAGVDNAKDAAIVSLLGVRMTDGKPQWDSQVFWNVWREPAIGIAASTILPKIPIIRTLPKKIPLVGKYLRW